MNDYKEYYSDAAVTITKGKMTVFQTTYPLEKILSYSIFDVREEKLWWKRIFTVTQLVGVSIGLCIVIFLDSINWTLQASFFLALGCFAVGAVIAYLAVPYIYPIKGHQLRLETASGEKSAVFHKDRSYIEDIARSLGAALDER